MRFQPQGRDGVDDTREDWLLDDRFLQAQKLASIGELSAGIAHEINNPLAIIRQEAEWMQHLLKKRAPERQREGRITGLPETSSPPGGSVHRNHPQPTGFCPEAGAGPASVAVNRLVEDMTRLVEQEAANSNIKIIRKYGNLTQIYSDAPQLRQVILNLLTNACQAIVTTAPSPLPPAWPDMRRFP